MRDLRSLMLLALPMLSLPVLALTADGGDPVKYNLKINKQPLSTALQEFATQYGVQIVFFAKVTDGHEAPALEGRFTAADAMTRLLEHTNLTFQQLNSKTIEVQPKAVATDLQTTGETSSVAPKSVVYLAQADVPFAPNSAPSETTRPTEGKDGETRLETVTITGTRIVRDGYSSPTPVTVAPVEELLEMTPTNIADALNKLPQFSVQFTTQSQTNAGAPAGNFLNLRGLGQGRTLVMVDGARVPGTSATGTVDVNTLPQALVQRVEIVTGGASAIYGSDAVGGVVNYIMNTHFDGLKGSIQGGVSTYGDGQSYKMSIAGGTNLFENGHIEAAYETNRSKGLTGDDRSYANSGVGYAGAGTAASPYVLYNNLRMATTTWGGYIGTVTATAGAPNSAARTKAQADLTAALLGQQFVGTGSLATFNNGAATGSSTLQVGGDGAYLSGMQLLKPVNTDNFFVRYDYNLTQRLAAFTQASVGLSTTDYFVAPTAAYSTTIISGNPYLPASAQAALSAASTSTSPATIVLSSLPQNLIKMQQTNQRALDAFGSVGLKGKVFNDKFNWDAVYEIGQGNTRVKTNNNINTSRFYAALDAVKDPATGAVVCNVSLTTSASLYPGCVPLDFIGQGNESAAALAYIMQDTQYTIRNTLQDVSTSISGSAFDNWAGPVSMAANAEFRRGSITETTNAAPTAPQLTGLRTTWVGGGLRGATPSTLFLNNTVAPQYGANSVWEAGGETVVPLLKDVPMVKNLEFNGAARYTEYSDSGPATTWKVGINYQPINDLRLRGTASRDIRAPNLFELYQAPTVSSVTITNDPYFAPTAPHANAALYSGYTVNQVASGSTTVKPEVATSYTWGLVYSPSWLPRFTMSADYYYISIKGVIANTLTIGGVTGPNGSLTQCNNSGGTSIYCLAVPRDPTTGAVTQINGFPVNLSEQYTDGMDVEASYNFDLVDIYSKLVGSTDLRVLLGYQPENVTISNPGSPGTNQAGASVARTRITGTLGYTLGKFKASWQTNYTGPHHASTASTTPVYYADNNVSPVVTHDLSLNYRYKANRSDLQLFLTVNNFFNEKPALGPPSPTTIPGAQSPLGTQAISPMGTYFTAGVRFTY